MNEQQRYLRQVDERARLAQQLAVKARRKADRAQARAQTAKAIAWAACLEHGAVVAEQRAAFDARTAEILRSAYALVP
jgi:hypothetical protein